MNYIYNVTNYRENVNKQYIQRLNVAPPGYRPGGACKGGEKPYPDFLRLGLGGMAGGSAGGAGVLG